MRIFPAPTYVHYVGDGQRTEFAFPFGVFNQTDVEVYVNNTRIDSGLSIVGVGNSLGGVVNFQAPPPPSSVVTIRRYLSVERLTDFQESSELRAAALNRELDYLTACLQQVSDDVSRCIGLSANDASASLVLPPKSQRSDKLLGFDTAGNLSLVAPEAQTSINGWRSLDDIPPGALSVPFSPAEKAKLAGIEAGAQVNAPQITLAEKATPVGMQVRSFSPADVRDIAAAVAGHSTSGGYFVPAVATADDSHHLTLASGHGGKALWVQARSASVAVTVRVPAGLPADFTCQLVNDTDLPLTVVAYGVGVEVRCPAHSLAVIGARNERATLAPTPVSGTWCLAGDLVPQ